MACDVCGKIGETIELNENLACRKMQSICGSCEQKANKMIWSLRHAVWLRVRKKLLKMQQTNKREVLHDTHR